MAQDVSLAQANAQKPSRLLGQEPAVLAKHKIGLVTEDLPVPCTLVFWIGLPIMHSCNKATDHRVCVTRLVCWSEI